MDGEHGRRCQAAQREMAARGIDFLVVTPSSDLIYLTGIASEPSERLLAFILPSAGAPTLVLPRLEAGKLEAAVPFAGRAVWEETEDPIAMAARYAGANVSGHPLVAIGDQTWSATLLGLQAALPGARFVGAGQLLASLRVIKSAAETDLLRTSAKMADEVFARLTRAPLIGKREVEVADLVDRWLKEAGLAEVSFLIVASGPASAAPHHEPDGRRLEPGDAVVFDYGGTYRHYQSDITRTIFLGQTNDEMRRVYAAVAGAQEAAFRAVGPGVAAGAVDSVARGHLEAVGLGPNFIHRTGHGLGLDVHEEPYIVAGSEVVLREGMVFSVEPGAYLPGRFGVRVEDIVVVTDSGAERLNAARRDMVVVGEA